MNTLEQICETKREHIRTMQAQAPLTTLEQKIKEQTPGHGFRYTLSKSEGPALIAEVKKASPSKGVIREDFDPVTIAQTYEQAGATCLSVLTDEPYFQGKDDYLVQIKQAVKLPLLRKDFILEPYQIFESRALGADCILLIMAALSDSQAKELYDLARSLTMDALVEVHDEEELNRAITLGANMIGVNSRNLKTLEVDIETAKTLAPQIPDLAVKVAESGIHTHDEIKTLESCGYGAFLVGESLMRQDNIAEAVRTLMTGT